MQTMISYLLAVLTALLCTTEAAVPQGLFGRAVCNRDNCYRDVRPTCRFKMIRTDFARRPSVPPPQGGRRLQQALARRICRRQ